MLVRASRMGELAQFGTINGIASMSEPAKIILVMYWVGDRNYVGFSNRSQWSFKCPKPVIQLTEKSSFVGPKPGVSG